MFPHRSYSIRQCLMAFGVALALPGLVFVAVLLWRYAGAERSRYEEEALGSAQRIMAAVDRELVGIQAAAQALAASSSLPESNFEAFQRQALATLQSCSQERPSHVGTKATQPGATQGCVQALSQQTAT